MITLSNVLTTVPARGFQMTYASPKTPSLSLFLHGAPAYSHLLLLPVKSKGLGPALTPNLLVDFVNAGSNVLLALSGAQAVPSSLGSLLLEMDIHLPADRNSLVVDHFNYDTKSAAEAHDVVLIPPPASIKAGVVNFFTTDGLIAFPRAVGQMLGNASPLLAPAVKAHSSSYICNPKEEAEGVEEVVATGWQIALVSTFQARNSARFTVLGSSEALENTWFDATVQTPHAKSSPVKTSNRAFAQKVSAWTFKELGVLRVDEVKHYLNEGAQKGLKNTTTAGFNVDVNPEIYRIKNDVHYSIQLSEWDMDQWVPFHPPADDEIQLEFSMLSPFHRINLQSKTPGLYEAEFKLPDQHGIFNFFVEYRRPFLTNVEEKRTVTVRHFAHDEWPRSFVISGAWPWISGIWVTVGGWVVFVALWLYSKPSDSKVKTR